MGKTIRRKDLKNRGYYSVSSTRGEHTEEQSNKIFHSDIPKRWSGISSSVKERLASIIRNKTRVLKKKAMVGDDAVDDYRGKTSRAMSNKNHQFD